MSQTGAPHPSRHRPWQGSAWIFVAELLLLPTGLVTAGYLTRRLGADGYGLLTVAASAMAWLQWTVSSMLARASNRAIAAVGDWRPVAAEVVHLHLLIGSAMTILVLLCAPIMAAALEQPMLSVTFRLLALDLLLLVVAQGYRGALIASGDHGWLSAIVAARWIVRMVAMIGFVSLGWSVNGAVGGMIVSSGLTLALSRVRLGALHRASSDARREIRRGLLTLAAPIAIAGIGARLFERADLFLLAAIGASTASLGHYGAAQNLTIVLSLLSGAVSPVVLATVTRLRRDGMRDELHRLQRDVLRLPYLILPFAAVAAGAAPDIIRVIYGAGFVEAAAPFALLMFSSAALVAVSVSTVLLIAADRARLVAVLTAPMLAALVALTYLLVPHYGTSGPAIASLIVAAVAACTFQLLASRRESVHVPGRTMISGVTLAAMAYSGTSGWATTSTVGIVTKLVAVCSMVLLALLLLRELPTRVPATSAGIVQ